MRNATWFVLAGMGIVFATLGLLVLAMSALNRWFGPEPAGARDEGRPAPRSARPTGARNA
ncbi:MAG: OadG family protein [Candidatus Rokubacteria bacterium]|nr:OadG family protein [Candidatus Rokubacteria bacterium]